MYIEIRLEGKMYNKISVLFIIELMKQLSKWIDENNVCLLKQITLINYRYFEDINLDKISLLFNKQNEENINWKVKQ